MVINSNNSKKEMRHMARHGTARHGRAGMPPAHATPAPGWHARPGMCLAHAGRACPTGRPTHLPLLVTATKGREEDASRHVLI